MFCIVDRRNKAPLIYKIVVSLRDEVHRVIIRIIATIFFSGKNSNAPIVARSSSNNKTSFHAKYTRNSSTRGYIYFRTILLRSYYFYRYVHESDKVLGVRWTLRIVAITLPFSPYRYSTSPKGLSLSWNEITDFRVTRWPMMIASQK